MKAQGGVVREKWDGQRLRSSSYSNFNWDSGGPSRATLGFLCTPQAISARVDEYCHGYVAHRRAVVEAMRSNLTL